MTNPHDDDDPDDVAARLRAQPPTPPPARWREEILAAAISRSAAARPVRWQVAARALAAWLWPHPCAYAGLLAAWGLVLVLRLATPAPAPVPAAAQFGARMDYPAVLARDLLALNVLPIDPARVKEGRP